MIMTAAIKPWLLIWQKTTWKAVNRMPFFSRLVIMILIPLWYAQEVEGVRPDIRIINYSLLGIDWYINQLRYKVNESDSIDVVWSPEQMEGGKRDYVVYSAETQYPQ